MSIEREPRILNLPKIMDPRGNLTFLESEKHVPFKIERVYWLYDVPGGEIRGGHAYDGLEEVVIALSGSFDVVINFGDREFTYSLNRSYNGLYIPNGLWRHIENFSTNAVALISASKEYDETLYQRDFETYKTNRGL